MVNIVLNYTARGKEQNHFQHIKCCHQSFRNAQGTFREPRISRRCIDQPTSLILWWLDIVGLEHNAFYPWLDQEARHDVKENPQADGNRKRWKSMVEYTEKDQCSAKSGQDDKHAYYKRSETVLCRLRDQHTIKDEISQTQSDGVSTHILLLLVILAIATRLSKNTSLTINPQNSFWFAVSISFQEDGLTLSSDSFNTTSVDW
mmetsp:Transcript_23514/g.65262  ORF Transcript_23514/g.65262 Transcript_23514/m.65262 type:complete len:203 (-) Transcript_23514:1364-1972(-)